MSNFNVVDSWVEFGKVFRIESGLLTVVIICSNEYLISDCLRYCEFSKQIFHYSFKRSSIVLGIGEFVYQTGNNEADTASKDDIGSHHEPFSCFVLFEFILFDHNLLLVFIHLTSLINELKLAINFTLEFGLNVVLNQFLQNLFIHIIHSPIILHSMKVIVIIITINCWIIEIPFLRLFTLDLFNCVISMFCFSILNFLFSK